MNDLVIISFSLITLIMLWVIEKKRNEENIKQIPIRININGIRGKSTITRLTTAILSEAGYNTVGKTTGTAPRIIHNHNPDEIEIERKPRGVNIAEQLEVIDYTVQKVKAEALVCECMAVNPTYQTIYQEEMIQANVGVIINVLEDHMDLMGPTLDEVALAFTSTIPYNGSLIIQKNEYTDYFREIAKQRNTKVYVADENDIPEDYLNKFNFLLFPNNVAIPLAIADALSIDREIALKGMLKANPDPGVLQLHKVKYKESKFTFINGFAVNDPESVLEAWDSLVDKGIITKKSKPIVLFNGRSDRIDRTIQFGKDCIPHLPNNIELVGIGEELQEFQDLYNNNKLSNVDKYHNFEKIDAKVVFEKLLKMDTNQIFIGIGNIHGHGYELLDYIYEYEGE